jgi:fibro-slime domain-containing protein
MILEKNMFKSLILVLSLIALGFSQGSFPPEVDITVILRDFQATHPDFEVYNGKGGNPEQPGKTGTMSCPKTPILIPNTATPMEYGEFVCSGQNKRGFRHILQPQCQQTVWTQPVEKTVGMVNQQLGGYVPGGTEQQMLSVYPVRADGVLLCDNSNFEQWFTDVPNVNHRINSTLTLARDLRPGTRTDIPQYYIDSDEPDGNGNIGYFPLDQWHGSVEPGYANWGKQNIYKLWCGLGENRTSTACIQQLRGTADPSNPLARNYGFTMQGWAQFTYNGQGEVFTFSGDDDMWIFIDGVLVADLGGVHLPTPQTIDLAYLASIGHGGANWTPGSQHDLHFFYADRQTDGSNLQITTTLSELRPSPYGTPKILKAEFFGTNASNMGMDIWSSVVLSPATIDAINNGTFPYSFVLTDALQNPDQRKNLVVTSISGGNQTPAGFRYTIKFDAAAVIPKPGEYISYFFNNQPTVYGPQEVSSLAGKTVTDHLFTIIGVGQGELPETEFVAETPKESTPFTPSDLFSGSIIVPGIGGSHSTGLAEGQVMPADKTGEIILSPMPHTAVADPIAWSTTWADVYGSGTKFGSAPSMNAPVGGVDANGAQPQFVKGGLGSNINDPSKPQIPTLCRTEDDGRSNCFGISFTIQQPFRINVMIYDHLGQYINRFSQAITAAELQAIQMASPGSPDPTIAGNAEVMAKVMLYPVSSVGRLIASGPYLIKIDLMKEALPEAEAVNAYINAVTPAKFPQAHDRATDMKMIGYIRIEK